MNRLVSLLRHPRPLRFLIAQVFWRTGWGHRITFPLRAFRLHLHPANLAWQLWVDRHQRDADLDIIRSLLKPGDTMIDVGANIGFTAMEGAHAVGRQGVVHAIEPHPFIHRCLEENLSLNMLSPPQVQRYAVAVADALGETGAQFTDDRRDDMNFMIPKGAVQHSGMSNKSITVPVTTLDVLFPDLLHCDLLKIDVEGAELAVLRGASSLLKKTRRILIEAGDPNSVRYGFTAGDLLAHLESAGFEVRSMDQGKGNNAPVQLEDYRRHVGNWLAFRS
ncbi:FkbM family methyltransferase [Prosthecobacter sp.]|uniref:FkbM family methyltransferase n=1 Tax=Prosthecobacter sp. TaxID=1965333 RepID=UPI002488E961|nr:FkbM family methyltransferase [Prosthecobacter sp.]MDI1314719.1 FkbM family methyltransferase [Prosthecobacter sp.]